MLKLPEWHKSFSIDTDACDRQIGCALFQLDDDGVRKAIGFWSRYVCAGEKHLGATERNCPAVVWAFQMLRLYIERRHFTLNTDHQTLKWLSGLLDTSPAPRLT